MKVLVTGGSGYLGTHVCNYFGGDDFSRRAGRDVLNLQDTRAVGDYDVVIHLAAHLDKSAQAAGEVFLTNVEGTVNVLREVKEDAVFIFASTKDVYGRFADNYALVSENCPTLYADQSALEWSKLIAEKYVEYYAHARKFRSCIFRLSTVYAPNSTDNTPTFVGHYANAINLGERLALPGEGRPVRDFLHVKDFAGACRAFIDSVIRHGLYNIGGGPQNSANLSTLVQKLETASGLQAVIDTETKIPAPAPLNYVTDLTLIGHELGWAPEISLDEGLKTLF